MPKKLTTAQFIFNAHKVHGNKYDYSQTKYTGTRNKIIIICRKHGPFLQTPNDHVSKEAGCFACANNVVITSDEFIRRSQKVHGNRYDYSNTVYIRSGTLVKIICNKHGEFQQTPNKHVHEETGCPKCAPNYVPTTDEFIYRAQQVHGDEYDYSIVKYMNSITEVSIICKKHGVFQQIPATHVNSQSGCPKCAYERSKLNHKGGYSEEYFVLHPEQTIVPAKMYVMEFINGNSSFIKVGVTTRQQAKERFKGHPYNTYTITPLLVKETTLFDAYTKEQLILSSCKNDKHFPGREFKGYTECLQNRPEILNKIKNILGVK